MKRRTASLPGLICACLIATACDQRGPQGNDMANDANAGDGNAAIDNNAMEADGPPRSILRPEIVPSPTPEASPEPIEAVIGFARSGLKLDDAARQAIDALLDQEVTRSGGPITLRGHTDSRGADGDNLVVSRRRAEAVRDYMVGKGVEAGRIRIVALGEARPIAPNATLDGRDDPEGRAKNRRVEVEIQPRIIVPLPEVPDNGAGK